MGGCGKEKKLLEKKSGEKGQVVNSRGTQGNIFMFWGGGNGFRAMGTWGKTGHWAARIIESKRRMVGQRNNIKKIQNECGKKVGKHECQRSLDERKKEQRQNKSKKP